MGYIIKPVGTHFCYRILVIVILFMAVACKGFCSDYTGHVSLTSGAFIPAQQFSDAFNVGHKTELGLSFDVKKKNWPISIAFDSSFLFADSKTSENQFNLEENKKISFLRSDTCLGVKKIFNQFSPVKPYICSGLYFVRIHGELSHNREIVAGIGYWFGTGVYFDLTKNLTCGLLWKRSKAKLNIFDAESEVGGNHFSLITGFHF